MLPMWSQPPSGIHLLWCGVLHKLQEALCSSMDLAGLQGHRCLTMVCTLGCRGVSGLAPGAPPAPPSVLTWVSAVLFLSHTLIPLSWMQFCRFSFFSPRGTTTAADLDQWRVFLGASWHWLSQTLQEASDTFLKKLLL